MWGEYLTAGSRGIRASQEIVRKGGAAARIMLIEAAANQWKVPAAECTAANGVITHTASGRTVTFGKVAEPAAKVEPPADIKLKDPKDWKLIGKSVKRLDTIGKVQGQTVYGIDVKLPGMVNAALKAVPVFGGQAQELRRDQGRVDEGRQEGDEGRRQCRRRRRRHLVARQERARSFAGHVGFKVRTIKVSSASIADFLKAGLDANKAIIGNRAATSKQRSPLRRRRSRRSTPIPISTTSPWSRRTRRRSTPRTSARCGVRCRTASRRWPRPPRPAGLPVGKCEVYKTFLGGGFGRRSTSVDYVRQAVQIAKEMPGTPVKLLWTREEDMTHGWYHPITQCKMTAGLDDKNNMTSLHVRISGQSILATVMPARIEDGKDAATFAGFYKGGAEAAFGYEAIPNILVDHAMRNPHVPPGFWRGVNINHNAIYIESFMDELAKEVGRRSARVPPQVDDEQSAPSRGAQRRRPKRRAGVSRRPRVSIAAFPSTWASAVTWRRAPKSRSTATR